MPTVRHGGRRRTTVLSAMPRSSNPRRSCDPGPGGRRRAQSVSRRGFRGDSSNRSSPLRAIPATRRDEPQTRCSGRPEGWCAWRFYRDDPIAWDRADWRVSCLFLPPRQSICTACRGWVAAWRSGWSGRFRDQCDITHDPDFCVPCATGIRGVPHAACAHDGGKCGRS